MTQTLLMSSAIEKLHKLLAAEVETYRKLIALTEREREALRCGDVADIAKTTGDKESLLEALPAKEDERKALLADLATSIEIPVGASLTDIIAHLDEASAQPLIALRQEFTNLLEQLVLLNGGNHLLIKTELTRIEATFDYLITTIGSDNKNYTARGDMPVPPQAATGNMLNWQV